MKKVLLVDFHGTIVDANLAWYRAYCASCPDKSEYIWNRLSAKDSRKEIAQSLGLNYDDVIKIYRQNLAVRDDVIKMIHGLNLPIIIVSNASLERLMADINTVQSQHNLTFLKIYSKENGKKPDVEYIERIIAENGFDGAYMIDNDIDEGVIKSPKVTNILVPNLYFFDNK